MMSNLHGFAEKNHVPGDVFGVVCGAFQVFCGDNPIQTTFDSFQAHGQVAGRHLASCPGFEPRFSVEISHPKTDGADRKPRHHIHTIMISQVNG